MLVLLGGVWALPHFVPAQPSPTKRIEIPSQFSDAGAVTLEDREEWSVTASTGKSTLSVIKRILIVSEKGYANADQSVIYLNGHSRVKGFSARTLKGDGSTLDLPLEMRRDALLLKAPDAEWRVLQFTFPAVKPGVEIQWQYMLEYLDPRSWIWWEVQDSIPVLDATLVVHSRSDTVKLQATAYTRAHYSEHCAQPEAIQFNQKEAIRFACRNVPAFEPEPDSPPENDRRLRCLIAWSFGSGDEFPSRVWSYVRDLWMHRMVSFMSSDEKAREIGHALAEGAKSDGEKVDRVTEWVRRHVALPSSGAREGPGSETNWDEDMNDVIERGYGSAEEVTLVTYSLLHQAGLNVTPILANDTRRGRFSLAFPDPSPAQHLMLMIQTDGQIRSLDPACRYCPPGLADWMFSSPLPNGIALSPGFVRPITVPLSPAEWNSQRVEERVVLAADGSAAVKGSTTRAGLLDVEWRKNKESIEWAARSGLLQSASGQIEDVTIHLSDVEDYAQNTKIDYEYRRLDMTIPVQRVLLLHPPDSFTSMLDLPKQEKRSCPIAWPFPRSTQTRIDFVLPAGYALPVLPPKTTIEGPGLRFDSLWQAGASPGEVRWTGQLRVMTASISLADYPGALEFESRMRRSLAQGIALLPAAEEVKESP